MVRYGQASIPIRAMKDETGLLIGKLENVAAFYGAVSEVIAKGKLDGQIGALQAEKSLKLNGK